VSIQEPRLVRPLRLQLLYEQDAHAQLRAARSIEQQYCRLARAEALGQGQASMQSLVAPNRDLDRLQFDAGGAATRGFAGHDKLQDRGQRLALRALAREHEIVNQRAALRFEARGATVV